MNTNQIFRTIIIALFFTISLSACRKEADVETDLANRVTGRYSLSRFELNGKTYPIDQTDFVGSMEVVRETATSVTLKMDVKTSKGVSFMVGTGKNITLTDMDNGEVELTKDGNKVGHGGKNSLSIRGADTEGEPFVITAMK